MAETHGRGRFGASGLVVLLTGLACGAEPAPEAGNLQRGLIAEYGTVLRLEPTIALSLKAGEAPHPSLPGDDGKYAWKGYLNLIRGGTYHFQARVRGTFKLTVAGQVVLEALGKDDKPTLVEGPAVKLTAGVLALEADYVRPAGAARLEVFWQGPGFSLEPLPFDVLGHLPAQEAASLGANARVETGRFLAEEHACARCHRPTDDDRMAKDLTVRLGPDLSAVGSRVKEEWIAAWLAEPNKVRVGAAMPALFTADANGAVERFAVARYLASLGGPVTANPKPPAGKDLAASAARGQKLFASTGCVACHGSEKKDDAKPTPALAFITAAPAHYPLAGLGSKTTPEKLAEYLQHPLATDPSGRMPHMLLQQGEAMDLAHFLCQSKQEELEAAPPLPGKESLLAAFKRVETRAEELAAFEKLPEAAKVSDLGKRLVIDRGCNNCHTIAPGGKPFASVLAKTGLEDLKKPERRESGCLAAEAAKAGTAPRFAFRDADRDALRAFLDDGLKGPGSPAPAYSAARTMKRLNCLACHSRDGEGGLTPDLVDQLRKFENAENAEAVAPPPLTGVGHKLRTPWLRQVLTRAGRARPWMGLRMPQFEDPDIVKLPAALAALEGTEPDDEVYKVSLTAAKIDAGRKLVGKTAFGCISCHDLAGVPNTGTRGPDLAGMNQRVRYDWYLRWLEQPQRMTPNTRMPSVFSDGKSVLTTVFDGDAGAQADAIWGYLSLGPGLPLPDGLEPPKGLVLRATDRPYILRTFMPDAGSRALAVGFPGGVSYAFDAHTCRLAYAWSGQFLDASPVWDGRGGNPAKVLGPRFWTAPAGCPVGTTSSGNDAPDFAARAKDPAYGGVMPEGKVYDGPALLHFDGYAEDKDGVPTFRYHLQAGTDDKVEVSERIEPLRGTVAAGVGRHFTLQAPPRQTTWLLVGETAGEPRILDAKGSDVPLALKTGSVESAAAGAALLLPQDGDRVVVLTAPAVPEGTKWRLEKKATGWQALLRVPPGKEASKFPIDLNVWSPYRNEPGLLKELLSSK